MRKQSVGIHARAVYQVSPFADWTEEQHSEAHDDLFRDWLRSQTQSSVTALGSLRSQMDVGSLKSAGTIRREALMRCSAFRSSGSQYGFLTNSWVLFRGNGRRKFRNQRRHRSARPAMLPNSRRAGLVSFQCRNSGSFAGSASMQFRIVPN
jgi:hypothetical protein